MDGRRIAHASVALRAARISALEGRAAQLQRLAEEIKGAHRALDATSSPSEKGRLRHTWLGQLVRWSELQQRFTLAMYAYEETAGSSARRTLAARQGRRACRRCRARPAQGRTALRR